MPRETRSPAGSLPPAGSDLRSATGPGPRPGAAAPTTAARALARAQRLLDGELPFAAHEVLEEMWRTSPAEDRALWRGLTQLSVGLTHLQRGNRDGAVALLRRGAGLLADARPRHGVDPSALAGWALGAAARAAAGSPPDQPLRLRAAHRRRAGRRGPTAGG